MLRVGVASAVLVLALTACGGAPPEASPAPSPVETEVTPTPTPTPTPTAPPALGELVLSAEGMGTLVFGEAPDADPATRMIFEDPEACVEFAPAGSPEATRWRPVPLYAASGIPLFGVTVTAGSLERIDVFGPEIPTDAGVRVGDPVADLLAAHPSATLVETDLTDVFVVTGDRGTLQLEVARERGLFDTAYWQPDQVDRVIYLHATITGIGPFTVAASENIAGGCL